MCKLNFVSNARINLWVDDDKDPIELSPHQFPGLISEALSNVTQDKLILAVTIFTKQTYTDYVLAIITTWDGIMPCRALYKLFANGKYDTVGKVDYL